MLPVIHIAGTNGKGSTARVIAAVLQRAGYRTGLYLSPHLVNITERIQINALPISRRKLAAVAQHYHVQAEQCKLTFFEFMTAIAFLQFAEKGVDFAVLETGLGGRYDATNVFPKPLLSIITNIDHDHKEFLGTRLTDIAREKAGIIKKFCPLVSGAENPSAAKVIRAEAGRHNAPLYEIGRKFSFHHQSISWRQCRQRFHYKGLSHQWRVSLRLMGEHQLKNASLALAAIEVLKEQGIRIEEQHIREALHDTVWPGRFQIIKKAPGCPAPLFILDGAHNPGAMQRFVATFRQSPWGKIQRTFIFAVMKDKEYAKIIATLAPLARRVILVPLDSPRALPLETLAKLWSKYLSHEAIEQAASFPDAIHRIEHEAVTGITGSLYLAGEALRYLRPTI